MISVRDILAKARATGDASGVLEAVPYARFLGITIDTSRGELVTRMKFDQKLIGNATIPALHGGTLGALLETTAVFEILWRAETFVVPKTINITIDYQRSGKAHDTYAHARIDRIGRRVASMHVDAWQEDRERPIASAMAHFLVINEAAAP